MEMRIRVQKPDSPKEKWDKFQERDFFSRRGAENAEKRNMGMGIFCRAVSDRPKWVLHESRENSNFPGAPCKDTNLRLRPLLKLRPDKSARKKSCKSSGV